jgi:hypothetical protein
MTDNFLYFLNIIIFNTKFFLFKMDYPNIQELEEEQEKLRIFWLLVYNAKTPEDNTELLARVDADPTLINKHTSPSNYTILMAVCMSENDNALLAEALLDRGAKIDAWDRDNNDPLVWACAKNNLNVALMLISKGATLRPNYSDGRTACRTALDCYGDSLVPCLTPSEKAERITTLRKALMEAEEKRRSV